MSDERLRALERQFRASGSPTDEAAWLRARVQAGEVQPDRLRLAALLGHAGAWEALGDDAPAPTLILREWDYPVEYNALFDMVRDCADSGCEALVRLTVALARELLPMFETGRAEDTGARVAIQTTERWLVEPEAVTDRMLLEAGWAAGGSSDNVIFEDGVAHDVAELAQRTAEVAQNALAGDRARTRLGAEDAALPLRVLDPEEAVRLEAVVREELVPWALSYADPVAARVAAGRRI